MTTMNRNYTDNFGREIKRNQVLAYPARKGSMMWMEEGRVSGFNDRKATVIVTKPNGRKTQISNVHNAVIAPRDYSRESEIPRV